MDAVMLIEVQDDHGRVQLRQRFAGAGNQCRIGRSLSCDIVIDDVHAAATHTLLTLQEDGRVHVQDLDTLNGTRIDGHRIASVSGEVIEQGVLIVGRTRVAVRTQHAALAPERVFRRDLLRRHRTLLAAIGVIGCIGFAAFSQWLNAPEQLAAFMLAAVLLTLAGLSIWVGFWSLIAHLNHGTWQVRIHLALAANCIAVTAWGYWLYRLGAFATQWSWLGVALTPLAIGIAMTVTYLHLRKATHMGQRLAVILASVVTLALGGTAWLIDLQTDARNVNRLVQGPAIFPPGLRIAPSLDVADYLSDAGPLKRAANRNRQQSLAATPLIDEE